MNVEKWSRTYLEAHPVSSWNEENGCLLSGAMQLYEALGDDFYLDFLKKSAASVMGEDGAIRWDAVDIPDARSYDCGRIVCFLHEKTGEERFRLAADALMQRLKEQPRSLAALPFYMEYETKYGKKEAYNEIVKQFADAERTLGAGGPDCAASLRLSEADGVDCAVYLKLLVDTMEHTSIEIYEKYRTLRDLFKRVLREQMDGKPGDLLSGYAVLKACRMGLLLKEKYAHPAMALVEKLFADALENEAAEETGTKRSAGTVMMAYAQYRMLEEEER